MYEGNNPTALQSQADIANSMYEHLKIQTYKSITIKSLCGRAHLSRQTFYALFDSKDEVVAYLLTSRMDAFLKTAGRKEKVTLNYIVKKIVEWTFRNRSLLELLDKQNLSHLLVSVSRKNILENRKLLGLKPYNSTAMVDDYLLAYMSGALSEVILIYIRRKDELSISELTDLLMAIIRGQHLSKMLVSDL